VEQARLRAMGLRWTFISAVALLGSGATGCTFKVPDGNPPPPLLGAGDLAVPDLSSPLDLDGVAPDLATVPDLASNPACTRIDEDFAADPAATWTLAGSAKYDATVKRLQITPPSFGAAGSAFFSTKLHVPAFDARFKFYIGDGSGADGMAMVFAKAQAVTDLKPFGDGQSSDGYGLGYLGMEGFALELDTYKNGGNGDPNDNHVALTVAASGTHFLVGTAPSPPLRSASERSAHVRFDGHHFLVEVDDKPLIDADLPSTIVFMPDDYFIGFTGASGGLTDRHRVGPLSFVIGPPDVCF
jgi:hypothetical protein